MMHRLDIAEFLEQQQLEQSTTVVRNAVDRLVGAAIALNGLYGFNVMLLGQPINSVVDRAHLKLGILIHPAIFHLEPDLVWMVIPLKQ